MSATPAPRPAPRRRFSWMALAVGLIVALPLLFILFRGLSMDPHAMDAPLVGKSAPEFALKRLSDGSTVSLADLSGRPLVLNFWSTWCIPCRAEHPVLVRAAREYGEDVQIVGIVYQDKRETVGAWLDRHGGRGYTTLIDAGSKTAIAYGVYGVPETFFIDAQGVIRDKFVGPLSPRELHRRVSGVL